VISSPGDKIIQFVDGFLGTYNQVNLGEPPRR